LPISKQIFIKPNMVQLVLFTLGILWQVLIAFMLLNRAPVYLEISGDFKNVSYISKLSLLNYHWLTLVPIFSIVLTYVLYRSKRYAVSGYVTLLLALIYNLFINIYIFSLFSH